MEIHKPKPWHGLREFLKEYAIVVVGVLTALAAEQAVETWHWHEKVDVVRRSLQGELANDRARWELDVASIRCMSPEIDKLEAWASGPAGKPPPPTPSLDDGLFLWMHSANWGLANGSQNLDHFPMREQLAYAAMYAGVANRQVYVEWASDSFVRINALRRLGDAQARRELRLDLGALRERFGALLSDDAYMRRHFDDLGVKPDSSDFRADLVRDAASGCLRPRP